ncbi:3-deoxy-D-manno-octulosonic acid transferase [Leptospira ognonensis]|uniref:3-deoxy-D-manno-octulosonic acid transferase n=1 Tax=Leptospira ognonensis TaxID=2484945 RepID=A0A4R9K0L6_9LEPT|nr:glycosyltransferase N-terminal domain-containing protein [Leptospira ognonensis]TGL58242.1 3-deoxy-D-manno-octulosonic acid transferase [Leptospira ognonensis]
MYLLYNCILVLLYPLLLLTSLFIPKARAHLAARKATLRMLLEFPFVIGTRQVVWLHGASVGELDQARAIAKILKEKHPTVFILQSIFSQSVSESQRQDANFDICFHLPFDLPFAYQKIIQKYRPEILMILAWDTWPNLIRDLKNSGSKTYLACASLSESSGRTRGFGKFLTKSVFKYLDGIFPSHEILSSTFLPLLSENTKFEVLGDSRFDAVLNRIETNHPSPRFQNFLKLYTKEISESKPILLGSTYPICESYFLDHLQNNSDTKQSYWIFPHKWEELRMNEFANALQKKGIVTKFSDLVDGNKSYPRFLLFDEMGILAFAYKYALLAYVGGGFEHRIHNTIEPAAFGLTLITGPKINNAPEAIVMQKLGGLFVCQDKSEFSSQLVKCTQNEKHTSEIGAKNRKFVLENRGASERIYLRVFSDALS